MKKISILILIIAIISLSIITLYAQNNNENENSPIGKVSFIKGVCYVKHEGNNKYKSLDIDNPIFTSDTVKTTEDSRVDIVLTDGSTVSVMDNSEITINQSMLQKDRFTNLGILYGTLRLFVKKLSSGAFNINTLLVTAGVRGTEFTMSARDDGSVLVDVKEGVVEVENNTSKSSLHKGDIEMYTITGEKKRLKGRIDYKKWRNEAIQKIKQNPEFYLNRMFEMEKKIIERLKLAHSKLDEYRQSWVTFLKRVKFLERRHMYEREKRLIKQQIKRTRRGLLFIIQTRRQLTAIRSIMVISYRIEKNIGIKAKKVPTIIKIRREYARISYIIDRLRQTEQTLRKVLYYLNVKYHRLNKRSEEV